jgi:hypothetical protein
MPRSEIRTLPIAELNSAARENARLLPPFERPADCKSAMRQVKNLRYQTAIHFDAGRFLA